MATTPGPERKTSSLSLPVTGGSTGELSARGSGSRTASPRSGETRQLFGVPLDAVMKALKTEPTATPFFFREAVHLLRFRASAEPQVLVNKGDDDEVARLQAGIESGECRTLLSGAFRPRNLHSCMGLISVFIGSLPTPHLLSDSAAKKLRDIATLRLADADRNSALTGILKGSVSQLALAYILELIELFVDVRLNSHANLVPHVNLVQELNSLLFPPGDYETNLKLSERLLMHADQLFELQHRAESKLSAESLMTVRHILHGHKKSVTAIVDVDNQFVWTADAAGELIVWDRQLARAQLWRQSTLTKITCMAAVQGQVWVGGTEKLQVYIAATKLLLLDSPMPFVSAISYFPANATSPALGDGVWVATNGKVQIMHRDSRRVLHELPLPPDTSITSFCRDAGLDRAPSEVNVWASATDKKIYRWNFGTLVPLAPFAAHSRPVRSVSLSGTHVWSTGEDGAVRVWAAGSEAQPALVKEIATGQTKLFGLQHMTDGPHSILFGWSGAMQIIHVPSQRLLPAEPTVVHSDAISGMIVLSKNNYLVGEHQPWHEIWTVSWDNTVCVWLVSSPSVTTSAFASASLGSASSIDLGDSFGSLSVSGTSSAGLSSSTSLHGSLSSSTSTTNIRRSRSTKDAMSANYSLTAAEVQSSMQGQLLGKGTYGTVYKATMRGKHVAVKRLYSQNIDAEMVEDFRRECEVMSRLAHPNIILFIGACFEQGNLMLVTELCSRGSVADVLYRVTPIVSLAQRVAMAAGAVSGMAWLHQCRPPLLHRDLKPSNLLVTENFQVKIADFGFSCVKQTALAARESAHQQHTQRSQSFSGGSAGVSASFATGASASSSAQGQGTPLYAAPEVLQAKRLDEKADVYSFGITFWEMVAAKKPFPASQTLADHAQRVVMHGERPPRPVCAQSIIDVIEACWHADPDRRPSFTDLDERFKGLVIDASIRNPEGCALWKKHFAEELSVPFTRFVPVLLEALNLPVGPDSREYRCLRLLLANRDTDAVAISDFSAALEWFGPPVPTKFLFQFMELCKRDEFHGHLNANEAKQLLSPLKAGAYLCRFSSVPGDYTISVRLDTKVNHFRVQRDPATGGLTYEGVPSKSWDELFKKHQKALGLKPGNVPTGSPFYAHFMTAKEQKKQVESSGYVMDFGGD